MSYKLEFDNNNTKKDILRKMLLWGAIILDLIAVLSLIPFILLIFEYLIILPVAIAVSFVFRILSRRILVTTTLIFTVNTIKITKKFVHKTIKNFVVEYSFVKSLQPIQIDTLEKFNEEKNLILAEDGIIACEFSCNLYMFMIELNDGKKVLINADKYACALFTTNEKEFV